MKVKQVFYIYPYSSLLLH